MKTLFIVILKTDLNGTRYKTVSNFYFKTIEDAKNYAHNFIKTSSTFTEYEIQEIKQFN